MGMLDPLASQCRRVANRVGSVPEEVRTTLGEVWWRFTGASRELDHLDPEVAAVLRALAEQAERTSRQWLGSTAPEPSLVARTRKMLSRFADVLGHFVGHDLVEVCSCAQHSNGRVRLQISQHTFARERTKGYWRWTCSCNRKGGWSGSPNAIYHAWVDHAEEQAACLCYEHQHGAETSIRNHIYRAIADEEHLRWRWRCTCWPKLVGHWTEQPADAYHSWLVHVATSGAGLTRGN